MAIFDNLRVVQDLFNVVGGRFSPFAQFSDSRGGRVTSDTGRPLHLADSRHAARRYSLTDFNYTRVPKPKFLFWVRFFGNFFAQSSSDLFLQFARQNRNSNWARGISFLVKNVDKPRITPVVEDVVQYNKRRLIHTGINYEPIQIKFHDDVNDDALAFWIDYYKWYFGDAREKSVTDWSYDQTSPSMFPDGRRFNWGFSPQEQEIDPTTNSFYLSHMDLYQFYGGYYSLITFVNPKIVQFDHDSSDYAEGAVGSEISMSIKYEGVIYRENRTDLYSGDLSREDLEDLLLTLGNYYQLPAQFNDRTIIGRLGNEALRQATSVLLTGNIPKAKDILTGVIGQSFPLNSAQKSQIGREAVSSAVYGLGGSVLNSFGDFSFGSETSPLGLFSSSGQTSRGELGGFRESTPYTQGSGAQLAARREVPQWRNPDNFLAGATVNMPSIAQDLVDTSRSTMVSGNEQMQRAFGDALASGARDRAVDVTELASAGEAGTAMTSRGLSVLNNQLKGQAQVGQRLTQTASARGGKSINDLVDLFA